MAKIELCIFTGTRADFGLLEPLIRELSKSKKLEPRLFVSGSHLSIAHGYTLREVQASEASISAKVALQPEDLGVSNDHYSEQVISKLVGLGIQKYTDALLNLSPRGVIILGDRYEAFAFAVSAFFLKIPIVHINGGELTEGALDDSLRHMITKMASFHFPANETYRKRIIQLGENPDCVFNVGGLGVDAITQLPLMSKEELGISLGIDLSTPYYLVTYHPETSLSKDDNISAVKEILLALEEVTSHKVIFTLPNADSFNDVISLQIINYCKKHDSWFTFSSLGQVRYLSCLKYSSCVIGNSSSGISEAPTFCVPTINIGERQRGRERSSSVIDVRANKVDILKALDKVVEPVFLSELGNTKNPYGIGGAAQAIRMRLETINFDAIKNKKFFDLHQFIGDSI